MVFDILGFPLFSNNSCFYLEDTYSQTDHMACKPCQSIIGQIRLTPYDPIKQAGFSISLLKSFEFLPTGPLDEAS
jgi:hypothetical protein